MTYPQLSFQVRINTRASLSEIKERVEKTLQCRFTTSYSNFFDGDEALEATALGLWITLSCDPEASGDGVHNYLLMGMLKGDLDAIWEDDFQTISINQYILGVLKKSDEGDWYVADLKELHQEAGLSFSD
ncbi:hypothetical protein [Oscillatoria sp. FACHB-1406]|uniref:hypothetical protein n=1 Tax=Oscillatoria sp. FACHB-1406 TaxID=2692846 RepID=UPI001685E127|nr:hypothetical protein [Oscillatoria sp. FACHB-1406]MBD2576489.1 hypothetical protein [Oscillatoria sp. FACHB-1406]